jgi:hypothetical protein
MSSLGYSDFAGGGGGSDANKRGAASADDGYIVAKRKNKTIKSFDAALDPASSRTSGEAPLNPKLERLKQSIAKIHTASSDDEDDDGGGGGGDGKQRTNMLPSYPGQGMGQVQQLQKASPPIADAGSGVPTSSSMMPPPSTAEGYNQQPMFSMSQQSASRTSNANNGNGGGVEHFAMKMPSTYAAQYYKQYVPYNRMSNELSSAGANSDELIEKLNYIVHVLEEQHNERTDHVAEELVLYCFLGVFIIFIVDSFARAGKYTR